MSELTERQLVDVLKSRDLNLEKFAELANQFDFNIALTLFTKGTVISGNTVSGKIYFEALASKYGPHVEGRPTLGDYFRAFSAEGYEPKENEQFSAPLNFLHLEKVHVLTGTGNFVPFSGGLLRIKIEEVDGYILGNAVSG